MQSGLTAASCPCPTAQGVWSAWVDDPFAQAVADVTAADLHLALERHLARFLAPSDPVHGCVMPHPLVAGACARAPPIF